MKKPDYDKMFDALQMFISTIDATGGVTAHTGDEDGGPACDPYWIDLGNAYRAACAATLRKPLYLSDVLEENGVEHEP